MRIDPTVTATVLVEAQTHPEILEAAREQMIGPAVERFRRVLRKGVERGELEPTWTSTSPPTPSWAATSPASTSAAARGRNGPSRSWTRSTRGSRTGRDSNPRWSYKPHTRLAGECLQPLGHLSRSAECRDRGLRPCGDGARAGACRVPRATCRRRWRRRPAGRRRAARACRSRRATRSLEAAQQRPAAGQQHALGGDVRRQLGRRLLQGRVDRGHDLGQRRGDRLADLLGGQEDLARQPGGEVAAADRRLDLLRRAGSRTRRRA